MPSKELLLAGKDAAAEYDELAEPQDFQDDPEWVNTQTHACSLTVMAWENTLTPLDISVFSTVLLPSGNPTRLVSLSKWSLRKKRIRMSRFLLRSDMTSATSLVPSGRARREPTLPLKPSGSLTTWSWGWDPSLPEPKYCVHQCSN